MRRLFNNIVSVFFTTIKFGFVKLIKQNKFKFYFIERFSPNVVTEFNKGCKVNFGKKIRVHSGSKIKVREGATLTIGDNVKVNYNCIIVCQNNIEIGEGTEFGPSVYVYDHDHDFRSGLKNDKYKRASVSIGKNCWIGANTVILRGTTIGDNCVVGAGCVVKGNIPSNSILVQKRDNSILQIGEC